MLVKTLLQNCSYKLKNNKFSNYPMGKEEDMVKNILAMVVFVAVMALILFGNAMVWAEDRKWDGVFTKNAPSWVHVEGIPDWTNRLTWDTKNIFAVCAWEENGWIYGGAAVDIKAFHDAVVAITVGRSKARNIIVVYKAEKMGLGQAYTAEMVGCRQVGMWFEKIHKIKYILYAVPEKMVVVKSLAKPEPNPTPETKTDQYQLPTQAEPTPPSPADTYAGQPKAPSVLPQLQLTSDTPFYHSDMDNRQSVEEELNGYGMPSR